MHKNKSRIFVFSQGCGEKNILDLLFSIYYVHLFENLLCATFCAFFSPTKKKHYQPTTTAPFIENL